MIQDVSLFEKIKQNGQWWLDPWWLKEQSKYPKNQIIIAFQKLKDIFDDKWFRNQLIRRNGHPVCSDLLGHFPFILDYLVKLGLDLKEIENCKNVDRVIKDLKSVGKYLSTRSVIEVSAELKRKGFDILFEPLIEVSFKYNPDFWVKSKDGKVYFEIKTLHPSGYELVEGKLGEKICQHLMEKVQHLFLEIYLETCPDFWKRINAGKIDPFGQLPVKVATTIDKIAKNIAQGVLNKINSGELSCKVGIEKVVITIKRGENKTHLRIGMSMRSLESEFKRAIRNLVNKGRKQLMPPYSPGIIGIKLFTLESSFQRNRDLALEIFQTEFQNNPSKYAHVIGIILILNSYPVRYEKRVIINPYTKFKSIGKNCGIF